MIPAAYAQTRLHSAGPEVENRGVILNTKSGSQSIAALSMEERGEHFVVLYDFKEDQGQARRVLRAAETDYKKIASQIGYSRYSDFWMWDERVKIIIFKDQETFISQTGQPPWSRGYAARDSELFQSRIIVTYRQEEDFLEGLLPHEISHLVLRDFIGFDRTIPIWFDEGIAQLQEANKTVIANRLMRKLIPQENYIPLDTLLSWDIREEKDQWKVILFYAQSLCVVDFLIRQYGSRAVGDLCRNLEAGDGFPEALRKAYPSSIDSVKKLEERWVRYMGGK